jgi:uncharacterized membrane protein YcaP (DUF421 family)
MSSTLSLLAPASAVARDGSLWDGMLVMQIPPTEKIIRTLVVYAALALLLRLAGKRQMAQLSTFDLVVALLLSNVVQNAIIGDDNSLTGGLLGAAVLVAVNAAVDRLCFVVPAADRIFNGRDTRLIADGRIDEEGLRRVGLAKHELLSTLHRQGADHIHEVHLASISPGGNITVELKKHEQDVNKGEFEAGMARLTALVEARFAELEAAVRAGGAR